MYACTRDANNALRIMEKVLRRGLTFKSEVGCSKPQRSIYSDSSISIAWQRGDKFTDLWQGIAFIVKLKGGEPELLSVPSAKDCPRQPRLRSDGFGVGGA